MVPIARFEIEDRLTGRGRTALEIEFRTIADFGPESLLLRVPALRRAAAAIAACKPVPERERLQRATSQQLNDILHSESVRELEASWRSLHRLLLTLPDLPEVRVRVLDLSKADLSRELRRYRGVAWDWSALYRKIVEEECGTWGGLPFNLLIGDYSFSHAYDDTRCLGDLSYIAAAADCVFIAGTSPRLLGLPSLRAAAELREPRQLFEVSAYTAWRSLRGGEDANRLALALPRVLTRQPYECALVGLEDATFVEDLSDPSGLPWAPAAYEVGTRLFTDLVLRAGYAGLPDAPTGGAFPARVGSPAIGGDAIEGRFDESVADELGQLGLIVVAQERGSLHLHYRSAHSISVKTRDFLGWRMLCGRLMHGLHDLARHLRGSAWTASEYELALKAWIEAFVEAASSAHHSPPRDAPLLSVELQATRAESQEMVWFGLSLKLSVEMRPLRPGRHEECQSRALIPADGGAA